MDNIEVMDIDCDDLNVNGGSDLNGGSVVNNNLSVLQTIINQINKYSTISTQDEYVQSLTKINFAKNNWDVELLQLIEKYETTKCSMSAKHIVVYASEKNYTGTGMISLLGYELLLKCLYVGFAYKKTINSFFSSGLVLQQASILFPKVILDFDRTQDEFTEEQIKFKRKQLIEILCRRIELFFDISLKYMEDGGTLTNVTNRQYTYIVTSRPEKYSFHIYIDISLDYASYYFLNSYLKLYEEDFATYGFKFDNPSNVSLPLVRHHKPLTRDFNSTTFQTINNFNYFKLLSPIELWNMEGKLWSVDTNVVLTTYPILHVSLDDETIVQFSLPVTLNDPQFKNAIPFFHNKPGLTLQCNMEENKTIEIHKHWVNVQNSIVKHKINQFPLDILREYITKVYTNEQLFWKGIASNISERYELYRTTKLAAPYLFKRMERPSDGYNNIWQSENVYDISSINDNLEEYDTTLESHASPFHQIFYPFNRYQLLELQKIKNSKDACTDSESKLQTLHEITIRNILKKLFKDNPFTLFYVYILLHAYIEEMNASDSTLINNARQHLFDREEMNQLKMLFNHLLQSCLTTSDNIGSARGRQPANMLQTAEGVTLNQDTNITENTVKGFFLERQVEWFADILRLMLNNGCVTSTLSFIVQWTSLPLKHYMPWIYYKLHPNSHALYILTKWIIIENFENHLTAGFFSHDVLYFLLHINCKQGLYDWTSMFQRFSSIVQKYLITTRNKLPDPIVRKLRNFFFIHIILTRKNGSIIHFFENNQPRILPEPLKEMDNKCIPNHVSAFSTLAYEIFENKMIYNPVLNVYEMATPAVTSPIILTHKPLPQEFQILLTWPRIQNKLLDIFLKIPHFIRHLHYTQIQTLLLSPIIPPDIYQEYCSKYPSYNALKFIDDKFVIGIQDLNKNVEWPENLDILLQTNTASYATLFRFWKMFVGILCTLSEKYIMLLRKASFLYVLFGTELHTLVGLPPLQKQEGRVVGFQDLRSNNSHTLMNTTEGDDDDDDDNGDNVMSERGRFFSTKAKFFQEVSNLCQQIRAKHIELDKQHVDGILFNGDVASTSNNDNIENNTNNNNNSDNTNSDNNNSDNNNSDNTNNNNTNNNNNNNNNTNNINTNNRKRKMIFILQNGTELLNSSNFLYELNTFDLSFKTILSENISHLPLPFLRNSFLLFSWIIKMGSFHQYNQSEFFTLLNQHRPTIFTELTTLVHDTIGHFVYFTSIKDLAVLLQDFCEHTNIIHTIPENEQPPFIADWNHKAELYEEFKDLKVYPAELPITIYDRLLSERMFDFYLGFCAMIIFSEFNADIAVDLQKFIAAVNFRGNYLRYALMLYNQTTSGKTLFANMLMYLFRTFTTATTLTNSLSTTPTGQFDVIAGQLQNNLLVIFNETSNFDPQRYKSFIDHGEVSSRNMYVNELSQYAINAKSLITCNTALFISEPAIMTRLFPIEKQMKFVSLDYGLVEHFNPVVDIGTHGGASPLFGAILLSKKIPQFTQMSEKIGLFLLNRLLWVPLFFFHANKPTSLAKSPTSIKHIKEYMIKYYPVKYFFDSIDIINSDHPIPKARLEEIIQRWWTNKKYIFGTQGIKLHVIITEILNELVCYYCPEKKGYLLNIKNKK